MNRVKRQPTEWEKISDKVLTSGIHRELLKPNNNIKPIKLMKKWAKDLHRHFSKEHIQMVNKHMKRCSTSPITRERQVKTTMRGHLTPIGMVTIINNRK